MFEAREPEAGNTAAACGSVKSAEHFLDSLNLAAKGLACERPRELAQLHSDWNAIAALKQEGCDPRQLRDIKHFAVFRHPQLAEFYLEKAKSRNFTLDSFNSNTDGTVCEIHLSIRCALDELQISSQSIYLRRLSLDFFGEYRGWDPGVGGAAAARECSVTELEDHLGRCRGNKTRHRHPKNRSVLYTDGIRDVFELTRSRWILDLIAVELAPLHPATCGADANAIGQVQLTIYGEHERPLSKGKEVGGRIQMRFDGGRDLAFAGNLKVSDFPAGVWRFCLAKEEAVEHSRVTTVCLPQER